MFSSKIDQHILELNNFSSWTYFGVKQFIELNNLLSSTIYWVEQSPFKSTPLVYTSALHKCSTPNPFFTLKKSPNIFSWPTHPTDPTDRPNPPPLGGPPNPHPTEFQSPTRSYHQHLLSPTKFQCQSTSITCITCWMELDAVVDRKWGWMCDQEIKEPNRQNKTRAGGIVPKNCGPHANPEHITCKFLNTHMI